MTTYEWIRSGKRRKTGGARNGPSGDVKRPAGGMGTAQPIGERLAFIRECPGGLTPRTVVEDARPDEALLHPYFEWLDDVAAEQWRQHQARHLISAVAVVVESTSDEPVRARAFVSIQDDEDASTRYEPLATVLNDTALYAQVCRRACTELEAFQDRYAQFSSLKRIGQTAHDAVEAELAHAISSAAPEPALQTT